MSYNKLEEKQFIKKCINQISYNITVILNELDFYADRKCYNVYNDYFKDLKIEIIDNTKYLFYKDDKYYRKNNVLYLERDRIIYWKKDGIYYLKNGDIISTDINKTFISLNDILYNENNIIIILKGIANLINKIIKNKIILSEQNKIIFHKKDFYKIINLNYFFYYDNGIFNVKDLWEFFINNKKEINKIGISLLYLYKEFNNILCMI